MYVRVIPTDKNLLIVIVAVGLSFDSSQWVKAGLISNDDMMDRNWAYWTTFSEVS